MGGSAQKSDIGRLICSLKGGRPDRTPNFEIVIDRLNFSKILGRDAGGGSWNVPPEALLEVARRCGQDAIPCPLHHSGAKEGSVETMLDFERLPKPDFGVRREKLKSYLKAVEGSGVGVCACFSGPLTPSYMLCGPIPIQSFMLKIYDSPELIDALLDYNMNFALSLIEAIADLPFDFLYIGDDVTGFMSPEHLASLWAPREERIIKAAKATGRPVLAHCCGPLADVLPYFSKWGVDAVNPIQTNVNDIYKIREDFPSLALVGNVDVNDILTFGTPETASASARELISRLAPAGGYVMASSHSILDSVKLENYCAMIRTAWESRI